MSNQTGSRGGVVVSGPLQIGNSLALQPPLPLLSPFPPACCVREKDDVRYNVETNCVENVFHECVDKSHMKFSSKLKPGYFVNTTDNIYICTSCHKNTGCAMGRSERVNSKPLSEQEASRHLASNECKGRKKMHANKTENIFIFELQSDMSLEAPEQFVRKGGRFDHGKFKLLMSSLPSLIGVAPMAIPGNDDNEDDQQDVQDESDQKAPNDDRKNDGGSSDDDQKSGKDEQQDVRNESDQEEPEDDGKHDGGNTEYDQKSGKGDGEQEIKDQYNEILVKEYCAQFERDLDKDNYTPITVNSEEEFRAVIRQFPFYKKSMEQEQFPRKFPFSRFVISAYTQAKQYLVGCLKFMDNLQLNTSTVDDTVRKCANVLLGRWAGILKTFVHKRVSMIQLVQITINLGYLEKSCESLGAFITSKTSGEEAIGTASHQVVLSEKVFRDVRSEVEQQIDECMRSKVDEIIELANYDWELPAVAGQASDFITDLVKFLLTTFQSFTNLPSGLAKHVCTQTCKHISQSLSNLLLSAETKCISTGALDHFSLDLMQFEMFATRCPVPGVDSQTLSMTFADLRQLLDLVVHMVAFNIEYRKDKYLRVKASTAIVVLEKMMEYERTSCGTLLDMIVRHLELLKMQ